MAKAHEINFDGLVGGTHHYGGLSFGNVASMSHKAAHSNPREAALQGLAKMKALADLGLRQAVLPPQERPDFGALRRLGFEGTDARILARAWKSNPELLVACSSAASMWTANAATVTPSADAADGKVHFTAANLQNKFHRSIEPAQTSRTLRAIFADERYFAHHEALPPSPAFGDEGAANHTRFCPEYGDAGLELFVYGRAGLRDGLPEPKRFPARQTLEASEAVARLHGLEARRAIYLPQNPDAIDAGAFHNDVVSVGNRDLFFCHEQALHDQARALDALRAAYRTACSAELRVLEVPASAVSLDDAVKSYLFNSQLVTLPEGDTCLIAPTDCQSRPAVRAYLDGLLARADSPIGQVRYFDLQQSMRNGGGPACLRLRVVLSDAERAAACPGVFLDETLHALLADWVVRHYRDRLSADDLGDPKLLDEIRAGLDALTRILGLGSIYPFQGAL
jgi:succinylarginine dihydrolase